MNVNELLSSVKLGVGVAATTATAGVTAILNVLPEVLQWAATAAGIALSVVLIRVHLLNIRKTRLEIRIMREQEDERKAEVEKRRAAGEATRRESD
jgi:cytochrome c biogenesis protein CcdA